MSSAIKYDRTLFEPEHDLFRESYRAFLDRHVGCSRDVLLFTLHRTL